MPTLVCTSKTKLTAMRSFLLFDNIEVGDEMSTRIQIKTPEQLSLLKVLDGTQFFVEILLRIPFDTVSIESASLVVEGLDLVTGWEKKSLTQYLLTVSNQIAQLPSGFYSASLSLTYGTDKVVATEVRVKI